MVLLIVGSSPYKKMICLKYILQNYKTEQIIDNLEYTKENTIEKIHYIKPNNPFVLIISDLDLCYKDEQKIINRYNKLICYHEPLFRLYNPKNTIIIISNKFINSHYSTYELVKSKIEKIYAFQYCPFLETFSNFDIGKSKKLQSDELVYVDNIKKEVKILKINVDVD